MRTCRHWRRCWHACERRAGLPPGVQWRWQRCSRGWSGGAGVRYFYQEEGNQTREDHGYSYRGTTNPIGGSGSSGVMGSYVSRTGVRTPLQVRGQQQQHQASYSSSLPTPSRGGTRLVLKLRSQATPQRSRGRRWQQRFSDEDEACDWTGVVVVVVAGWRWCTVPHPSESIIAAATGPGTASTITVAISDRHASETNTYGRYGRAAEAPRECY